MKGQLAHHKAADLCGVVPLCALGTRLRGHALGVVQEEVSVVRLSVRVIVATRGRHEAHIVLQPHGGVVLPCVAGYASGEDPAWPAGSTVS